MHELAIAQNIVNIVRDEMAQRNLSGAVETVVFRAGRLHAVVPDILRFDFDIVKKDFVSLHEARLEIQEIPLRVRCRACRREADLEEPVFLCLECGSPVDVQTGQDMSVDRIVLRDDGPAPV